jgi:hypothetical protein
MLPKTWDPSSQYFLMIVTAGTNRYELFISSSEQNNAKVVFDLKE